MIQPPLSLVDFKSNFVCPRHNHCPLVGHYVRENPCSCDCAEIRTRVPTSEGFEVTNLTTGTTALAQYYYQMQAHVPLAQLIPFLGAGPGISDVRLWRPQRWQAFPSSGLYYRVCTAENLSRGRSMVYQMFAYGVLNDGKRFLRAGYTIDCDFPHVRSPMHVAGVLVFWYR